VTAVHKANIMKLGDGLFLRSCEEIASLYPNIKFDAMIVDNTTMQVMNNIPFFMTMALQLFFSNHQDDLTPPTI
jgi:isocitrate dehydrogenase (NAD+)